MIKSKNKIIINRKFYNDRAFGKNKLKWYQYATLSKSSFSNNGVEWEIHYKLIYKILLLLAIPFYILFSVFEHLTKTLLSVKNDYVNTVKPIRRYSISSEVRRVLLNYATGGEINDRIRNIN